LCAVSTPGDTAPDPPGPGISRREQSEWPTYRPGEETRNSASCRTFLAPQIAVELAEQRIAVFLGSVGQVRYEAFDLLAGGFAESLGAAEIDGVGLHQVGVELVLADQLTEAVADLRAAVVSVLAIDWLGWKFLRLPGGWSGFRKQTGIVRGGKAFHPSDNRANLLVATARERPELTCPSAQTTIPATWVMTLWLGKY
jgi:hypothetical protein